jgi:hypothetical protein
VTQQITDVTWGALSTALHRHVPDGMPAFKDNAYLAFWSPQNEVIGVAHVSTSPNAEGRRARLSLSVRGRRIEIIEDLQPATFKSVSITFGLDDTITVNADRINGTLRTTPLFEPADYGKRAIIPPLIEGHPVQHFQQAAVVEGDLTIDDQRVSFTGRGLRDRTWGYREESSNLDEYIAILLVSEDWALTAMRFVGTSGVDLTEGYQLGVAPEAQPNIQSIGITRDASGLFAAATILTDTGQAQALTRVESLGGFWVPMGWTKNGPAMSAYDEFVRVRTANGDEAIGVIEHGILRRLH